MKRHETSWRHLTLLPSIYVMKNTTAQYYVETQIYDLSFMQMAGYPFKVN